MSYLTSHKSIDDAFKSISQEVLINDVPQQAYITNAHLGMYSTRHMHSLEPFNQGDVSIHSYFAFSAHGIHQFINCFRIMIEAIFLSFFSNLTIPITSFMFMVNGLNSSLHI
jgi:hypothetical protein